jgi:hypothetical protein
MPVILPLGISVDPGAHGTVTPADVRVDFGADQTFEVACDAGYEVLRLMVNGDDVGKTNRWTFFGVDSNQTLAVEYNGMPVVTLLSPMDGWHYTEGDLLTFEATVSDPDGDDLPSALRRWRMDGAQIATGMQVQTGLVVGSHTVAFSATDIHGATGMAAVTVFADTNVDGDGMPDWWEEKYFESLDDDAGDDSDGDGVSNYDEWRAGTDPTDAASVFRTEITGDNPLARRIELDVESNRTYRVLMSTNLLDGFTEMLRTNTATHGVVAVDVPDTGKNPGYFKAVVD